MWRTGIIGKVLAVAGESEFVNANITNDLDVSGQQLLNTKSRVFQRADINNSLKIIGKKRLIFHYKAIEH